MAVDHIVTVDATRGFGVGFASGVEGIAGFLITFQNVGFLQEIAFEEGFVHALHEGIKLFGGDAAVVIFTKFELEKFQLNFVAGVEDEVMIEQLLLHAGEGGVHRGHVFENLVVVEEKEFLGDKVGEEGLGIFRGNFPRWVTACEVSHHVL